MDEEIGHVEQVLMHVDGIDEDDAVQLLMAFNFNVPDALAYTQPKQRAMESRVEDKLVQDWQLLDVTCDGGISRVAVPHMYTAGQLKHRLLTWFGPSLGLGTDAIDDLIVMGLPHRSGSSSGIEPLCHLQLGYPLHRLEVHKSRPSVAEESAPSSSSSSSTTLLSAPVAGLPSSYTTPMVTNGLSTVAAVVGGGNSSGAGPALITPAMPAGTPVVPVAPPRQSPPQGRRRRQAEMVPITIVDSDDEDVDYQPVRARDSSRRGLIALASGAVGAGNGTSDRTAGDDDDDDDDNDDEYEDAMDFYPDVDVDMAAVTRPAATGSMIPQNVSDGAEGTLAMMSAFRSRFGDVHPDFFIGPLSEAIQVAFTGHPSDRRLLAVYVHHDQSITANVFCSQVLCALPFVNYLSLHCITWAWDVTHDSQRANLMTMVSRHLGEEAASALRFSDRDTFPTLVLISQTGLAASSLEVSSVIPGVTTLDQAVAILMSSIDDSQHQKEQLLKEHAELEARRRIIKEQEEAFEASLAADRLKAEQQEAEEAKAQVAEAERLSNEKAQQVDAENKQRLLEAIAASLPDEPPVSADGVCSIGFRVPSGDKIMRRFLPTDQLDLLFSFATSKGYSPSDYSVFMTYPRKDLTLLADRSVSLQAAGVKSREMLLIEEKFSSDAED